MQTLPQTENLPTPQTHAEATARASWFPYPLFFLLYGLFAIYFYRAIVAPYLATSDLYATRILADAITYESICVSEIYFLDWTTLRDIGPCIGLRAFSYNSGLLSIFNAGLIVFSVIWLAKVYDRSWRPLLAWVLINPLTFLSIFGPNKEVFGLTAFAMLAIFIRTRSMLVLAICLVAALFTRLPAMIIIGVYCLMLVIALPRAGNISAPTIRRYCFLIAAMVATVSVIAAFFGGQLQYSLLGDFSRADDISQSLSISLSLDYLSDMGLYIINYAIRLVLNLYSGALGITYLLFGESADYYSVGVASSSILFAIFSVIIAVGRPPDDLVKNVITWNIIIFIIFFTLVICLSPVIQHRYFYPFYVLLLLFVIKQDERVVQYKQGGDDISSLTSISRLWVRH